MRLTSTSVVAANLLALVVAADAHAHARLVWPEPRSNSDSHKYGPCGNDPVGSERTEVIAGTDEIIEFEETISHPGWFRLALSIPGNRNFNVIMDDIPHSNVGSASRSNPRQYDVTLTIPDTPCDNCTLQLIQVMTDSPDSSDEDGYEKYYSCADIRIVSASSGGTDGGASSAASSSSSGGGGDSGGGDGGGDSMGCTSSSWSPVAGVLLFGLWRRRSTSARG